MTQRDRHQLPFAPRAFGSRSQAPPGLQASALGSSSCGQQGSSPLSIFDAVAELYNQYPAQSIAFSGPAVALQLKFVAINSATSIKKKKKPKNCITKFCTFLPHTAVHPSLLFPDTTGWHSHGAICASLWTQVCWGFKTTEDKQIL